MFGVLVFVFVAILGLMIGGSGCLALVVLFFLVIGSEYMAKAVEAEGWSALYPLFRAILIFVVIPAIATGVYQYVKYRIRKKQELREQFINACMESVEDTNIEKVKRLLKSGSNPNVRTGPGTAQWTPLMMEADRDNIELVEVLLKAKAKPNLRNNFGKTALKYAQINRNTQMIELLKKYGAK
ncbi:ankyrin repeat domain-containing protein [Aneurinibacillus aneurinilyticus]|uniref:ankyrin repeat domain-containing protein n=1 Tax=Aneurinibacillus aneurinilyticus TaxID=1391 RepID=UPI00352509DB